MSTLEKAIALAANAHAGQVDKGGEPYILHPLRVMLRLKTAEERMAGVLHDVVEDCGVTFDDLRKQGFPEAVISGVDAVTRRDGESYYDFVIRSGADPIGRTVKLADLRENSDLTRLKDVNEKDRARLVKYQRAIEKLMALPAKGAVIERGP